jgi:hypothetical protein
VRAVSGTEGVVDEDLTESRKAAGQRRIVAGLTRLEAAVLEHQYLTRLELASSRLDAITDHRGRLTHVRAAELGKPA